MGGEWQAALFPAGSVRGPGTAAPWIARFSWRSISGSTDRGWPTFEGSWTSCDNLPGCRWSTSPAPSHPTRTQAPHRAEGAVPGTRQPALSAGSRDRPARVFSQADGRCADRAQPGDAGNARSPSCCEGRGAPSGSLPRWSTNWATPR